MDKSKVDTDQILPARFLRRPRRRATPSSCSATGATIRISS